MKKRIHINENGLHRNISEAIEDEIEANNEVQTGPELLGALWEGKRLACAK